jgi:hypothetical protein
MPTEEILCKKKQEEDGSETKLFLIKERGADVDASFTGCTFRITHSSTWENFDHANCFYNSIGEVIADNFQD